MKRKFLLTLITIAGGMTMQSQNAYLACDFTEGIPSTFTLYDNDGLEPSTDMKNLGFAIGTPWLVTAVDKDENSVVCSTSWYKTAGTSDDWMITPAIYIESETSIISWRAKTHDKDYRDGYSIYISETGTSLEDFAGSEAIFSMKSENFEWTERQISLADYAGKTIYIAFVNDSKDKSALYIDDLFVGVPARLSLSLNMPRVITYYGNIILEGSVTNVSPDKVESFSVGYTIGDFSGEKTFDVGIASGETYEFSFESDAVIERNESADYLVWASAGDDSSATSGRVSAYMRRIVAEEVTGTWCGYCVRGIVAMKEMKEKYPDSFLGIAVHDGTEKWTDPMAMPEYTEWLFSKFAMSGYPHATVNRKVNYTGDPANIENYYTKLAATENVSGLKLTAEVDKETRKVNAHTDIWFAKDYDDADFRLAYVVIENDVHDPEDVRKPPYYGYCQSNYYAGGSMGGFEDLPSTVPADKMWFQDVARYITDGYEGIAESIPAEIREEEKMSHDFSFTLPDNILKDENAELAVLLIRYNSGDIFNADVISLREFFSGVENVEVSSDNLTIGIGGSQIEADGAELSLYGIDGSLVKTADNGIISTEGLKGIYIIKAEKGTAIAVRKIVL